MTVADPYLIFLGDVAEPRLAKVAYGAVDWAKERCMAQLRTSPDSVLLDLPEMTIQEAAQNGARTFVIGIASPGGRAPEEWRTLILEAINRGMDVAFGLHQRLDKDPELSAAAAKHGVRLISLREPPANLQIGSGKPRRGHRVLTVGTDCAVGKKYTALAIWNALKNEGVAASFCATGQTGVLISGQGFAVDSVISDFISGAAEQIAPETPESHWSIIEGQGSLFHPAYAGVALGLIHGSQPEAIVLCHEAGRERMAFFEHFAVPGLKTAIDRNLEAARLTSPNVYCAGISVNTSALSEEDARRLLETIEDDLQIPAVDSLRTGVSPIVSALLKNTLEEVAS